MTITMSQKLQTIPIKQYLDQKGIQYRESNGELISQCLFNNCDADSRGNEAHLYFDSSTSQYHCKKCNETGNIYKLAKYLGDKVQDVIIKSNQSQTSPKKLRSKIENINQLVNKCHRQMPDRIREYLNTRGIPDNIISRYKLGYGDFYGKNWITIPINDPDGNFKFFKLRKDPQLSNAMDKYMVFPRKGKSSIYGLEMLKNNQDMVVICEGELDRLVLISQGIPAVTSTAGATTFKQEWISYFKDLREIYICLDKDEGGQKGTERLIKLFSDLERVRIYRIDLPDRMTDGKDITDYFTRYDGNPDELMLELPKWVAGRKPIDVSQFQPITAPELMKTLGLTIKKDNENKLVTLLCQLSAYTENAQFNISFNAPSSTGKSYIPTEIAQLFPPIDVLEIGYCSPTAFFHDIGTWDKERKGYQIDLSRKILIFLDQPHPMLLERLRPLLSHDKKEMQIKITDKSSKYGLRTKNVFIKGFPAVIFCSAGLKIDEQESTRFLLLSPETSQEKIREGIQMRILKETDENAFKQWLAENPDRKLLIDRIEAIRDEQIQDIKIPNPEVLEQLFLAKRKVLKPRHQRDIGRLISLIKVLALLNLWFREREDQIVIASESDVHQAVGIWEKIAESQEYNLPPYIYNLYKEIIVPAWQEKKNIDLTDEEIGLTRQEVIQKHFDAYERMLPNWQLRQEILPMLEVAGLITQEQDPKDKRKKLIYPVLINNSE